MTPRGRAAVASLMLIGQDAFAVIEPCLVLPKSEQKPSTQVQYDSNVPGFAYFQLSDTREEVVLHFLRCDIIELHCHGGDAVVSAIETTLVERGAASQTWQDWLLHVREEEIIAYHKPLDIFQREALQLLPLAETELTSKLLLAQYHGALSRRIKQLADLLDTAAQDELPDNAIKEAKVIVDSLLASYTSGRHLTTPFCVGLIGPVNVGKSSLMNALVGFNRSITSQIAGTTRDTVSATTVIAGWQVTLIDTAGIRDTSNPIEREGIARMHAVIAESDLVLSITDAQDYQAGHHLQIIDVPQTTPIIPVVNKIDLVSQQAALHFQNLPNIFPVSALTGEGLAKLNEAMLCKLHKPFPLANDDANISQMAMIFTERQYSQLAAVRELLNRGENVTEIRQFCATGLLPNANETALRSVS